MIFIAWMIIASKSPSENRFISNKERNYLEKIIENDSTFNNKIPWLAIMKSKAFWSLGIAGTAHFSSSPKDEIVFFW